MFKIVDEKRTDVQTLDHGYTISSPGKPSAQVSLPEDQWSCKRSPDILAK